MRNERKVLNEIGDEEYFKVIQFVYISSALCSTTLKCENKKKSFILNNSETNLETFKASFIDNFHFY